MAAPAYSVTLHHLAPGARAAGLGYPDEQLPSVTPQQLTEMLQALQEVAAGLTIYEPSSPEIRIKTDRDSFVVRTRYRRLCLVGREVSLRGEDHSIPLIVAAVAGLAEPVAPPPRTFERTLTASPLRSSTAAPMGGGKQPAFTGGFPEWAKIALLLALSLGCLGGGVWMLLKPARPVGPKFSYLSSTESDDLLRRSAGEYRTGTGEGDRRMILGADGTLRLAKFGANQAIAEEVIRTARGASQNGQTALATTDPYLMLVQDPNTIILYGQTYKRVNP